MGRAHEVRAASMAKTAAVRSKANAKFAKTIYMAAKLGFDPASNTTLKLEIDKANKANVSKDVINRAIERAKGGNEEAYISVRYEGFGPNNSLFIVDCLTDNPNRTFTEIRTIFNKCGFKLGQDGSVVHMFQEKAVFSFENFELDKVIEGVLERDINIEDATEEDGIISVFADAKSYGELRDALTSLFPDIKFLEDHIAWIPTVEATLTTDKDREHLERFRNLLDENDDVQEMYTNVVN